MTTTKKSFLALLLTAMVTIGLSGCSQGTNTATANDQSTQNLQLNNTQTTTGASQSSDPAQAGQTGQSTTGQNANAPVDPNANDPAIAAVQKAFNLGSSYISITMVSLPAIAMNKFQLPIEKSQSLTLAKALSSAMADSGWQQGDPNPGMFVSRDGSSFAIGMKKKNGDLTLQTFEYQSSDKSYKSVKQEVKKG